MGDSEAYNSPQGGVTVGTVHKGGVRAGMVRKTVLRVLRALRVYKRAL
jgi:hypothetical protein